jgi:hypothetical protein
MLEGHVGSLVAIGVGATFIVDLWALARRRLFGHALPNWAFVGRWFAHLARGTFRHRSIASAAPVRGELAVGWLSHYLVGIGFASLLCLTTGASWLEQPTPLPAITFGIATVAAPFLILQPSMGLGIAGSRTGQPSAGRIQSLITHVVFGVGLYATALLIH